MQRDLLLKGPIGEGLTTSTDRRYAALRVIRDHVIPQRRIRSGYLHFALGFLVEYFLFQCLHLLFGSDGSRLAAPNFKGLQPGFALGQMAPRPARVDTGERNTPCLRNLFEVLAWP